jgi:predicted XRE-type DNA-binding protein
VWHRANKNFAEAVRESKEAMICEQRDEKSSGNVFADLRLEDADELYARAQLGSHAYKLVKERDLKQREIASLLGVKQPEVSHMMDGYFNEFTTDKLLEFLKQLDRKVTIHISSRRPGEPFQEVGFGL